MLKKLIFLFIFFQFYETKTDFCSDETFRLIQNCDIDWLIIGAGPAGIITVGLLRDLGVLEDRIMWVDPEFNVGRLSTYQTVSANSKNKSLVTFLEQCKTFVECAPEHIKNLKELDPEKEYPLQTIVEPLQEITNCMLKKIKSVKGNLESLNYENNCWNVKINNQTTTAYHVVLATGGHPKSLNFPEHQSKEIHLDKALNKSYLQSNITSKDIVAVFGSAHSAILILKFLSEIPVKKIINFYNKPIQYPIDMGTWTLNDETGIKGMAAEWAKNVLEKNPPLNLIRLKNEPEIIKEHLKDCTKIIYAIGFEKNELPTLQENPHYNYDMSTGIIGPRLFGIGIAFPEKIIDPLGNTEYKVGLNSFIDYAQKVIPCWMQKRGLNYSENPQMLILKDFEELFNIQIL